MKKNRVGTNNFTRILCAGGLLFLLLLAVAFYMEVARDALPLTVPQAKNGMVAQERGTPEALPDETPVAAQNGEYFPQPSSSAVPSETDPLPEEEPGVHRGVIASGETAGKLLQTWWPPEDVHSIVASCNNVFSLKKLRAGQPYVVIEDETGFARFEYEIDSDKKLVVCREETDFVATLEPIEYDVLLERVQGSLDSSLFESMARLGETPVLAVRLAEIFAWEINFIRDVQPGDSFSVLVEKRYREGEFSSYGKVLAAEFVNQSSKYEAFSFADSFGNMEYYTAAGDSVKRAFLKAPLSFTRISSGFSKSRMHPVLHYSRPHPAIDYAAPTGTPVKAIGNGEVTYKGWGTGAGNYISLRHANGYESMYLHLSGFARGLQKGSRVKQGEVIGFVGSTGYTTGPHLDFRMKKSGQFINPAKTLSPRAEAVNAKTLPRFKAQRDLYRQYLEGSKDLTEYTLEKEKEHP